MTSNTYPMLIEAERWHCYDIVEDEAEHVAVTMGGTPRLRGRVLAMSRSSKVTVRWEVWSMPDGTIVKGGQTRSFFLDDALERGDKQILSVAARWYQENP